MDKKRYKTNRIFAILLIGTLVFSHDPIKAKKSTPKDKPTVWITIFVHGIVSAQPVLSFRTMRQIAKDEIEGTLYEKFVENVRPDPYFNDNQPKQAPGLLKIDATRKDADDGCPALVNIFEKQYEWIGNNKIKNLYYTFGWSGFLSHKKRYIDAKNLYKALSKLVAKLNSKGINPKIRLIGFSHGASVCLNLATVRQKENFEKNVTINELILLGMPNHKNTDFLINDPIFKKIFNFYSGADRIQIIDVSNPNKLFSRRKFKSRRGFKLPKKLIQVKLQLLRKFPSKGTNIFNKNKLTPRHSRTIKECSPGHCEWWFFRWTSKFYRDHFVLEPLPVIAIVPSLIDIINTSGYKPIFSKRYGNLIKMSVRPYDNAVILCGRTHGIIIQLMPDGQFEQLKKIPYNYPFRKITNKEYNQKVREKIDMAKKQLGLS